MIISSSQFSPLPVFKIDYFFLPNKAEILPLSLEIWHQLTSSEIQMLGKHVIMHLFETTWITFPIRSAYACTLSLQFLFHNFFSSWIFALTAEHPCLNGSIPILFCCDHQLMPLTVEMWSIWLNHMLCHWSWQGCSSAMNVVRTSSTLDAWPGGID